MARGVGFESIRLSWGVYKLININPYDINIENDDGVIWISYSIFLALLLFKIGAFDL
jgi:hypothetical protein